MEKEISEWLSYYELDIIGKINKDKKINEKDFLLLLEDKKYTFIPCRITSK